MTIRGLFREFVVAKRAHDARAAEAKWAVWHTAALSRADIKLPDYNEFARSGKRQTAQEQEATWKFIGDSLGTRRKHKKGRVKIIRFKRQMVGNG